MARQTKQDRIREENMKRWEASVLTSAEANAQGWDRQMCEFWIAQGLKAVNGSYMDGFEVRAKIAAAERRLAVLNSGAQS